MATEDLSRVDLDMEVAMTTTVMVGTVDTARDMPDHAAYVTNTAMTMITTGVKTITVATETAAAMMAVETGVAMTTATTAVTLMTTSM